MKGIYPKNAYTLLNFAKKGNATVLKAITNIDVKNLLNAVRDGKLADTTAIEIIGFIFSQNKPEALRDFLAALSVPVDYAKFNVNDQQRLCKAMSDIFCGIQGIRQNEILKGSFSLRNLMMVYTNENFMKKTWNLDYTRMFSMARAIELNLKRYGRLNSPEQMQRIISLMIELIFEKTETVILNSDSHMIVAGCLTTNIFFYEDVVDGKLLRKVSILDSKNIADFAVDNFGVKRENIQRFDGPQDKDNIINAIKTSSNAVFWFNGHGSPEKIALADHRIDKDATISYQEFAEALKLHAKVNGRKISDLVIILDCCRAAEFIDNVINYLFQISTPDEISDMPLIIGASNIGSVGVGEVFPKALSSELKERGVSNDRTLRLKDIYGAEKYTAEFQSIATYLPITNLELEEIRQITSEFNNKEGGDNNQTKAANALNIFERDNHSCPVKN